MSQHAIWHNVKTKNYKTSKSWGGDLETLQEIFVGSSSKNSHKFADIKVTREYRQDSFYGHVVVFDLKIDDILLKEFIFQANKNGKIISKRPIHIYDCFSYEKIRLARLKMNLI